MQVFRHCGTAAVVAGLASGCVRTVTVDSEAGMTPPACTIAGATRTLAAEVRETSGFVRGRTNPEIFWTHNDSGNEPVLFALDADGTIKARVPVRAQLSDWEDLEGGACGTGNCLYLADIGDNAGRRTHVSIYEVVEPTLTAGEATVQRVINAQFSDGPQDAEALFRLPQGELYVVSKGRQKAISLYRLNAAGTDGMGTLQLVREIAPRPAAERDRVTAATASPDGKWVAIRSYATLFVYRTSELLNGGAPAITQSLVPLGEKQGESIVLDNDGTIWMTSEAELMADMPTMATLRCALP